jgi:hypothetical protein
MQRTVAACFTDEADELQRFVGGDAAGDHEENVFVF